MKTSSKIVAIILMSMLVSSTFAFLTYAQVPSADIGLTVTPNKVKVVSETLVAYLYNVTNTGDVPLTGAIYDYTFGAVGNFVNLAPGGWVGYNITHVITQNTTNTAITWGVDQYGRNVTDTASAFVQVYVPSADIGLTVTPNKVKVISGTAVSYLYNATNTGEVPLTGAIYDDVFGPVGNFVNLSPNGWVGYNITHTITQNTSNTAIAWGVDQYSRNVTDSASAFVQVYVPSADISLTVTPSKTKVVAGTSVAYLYNATNTGELPLTGAIYDDVFGMVGNFVNLAPGGWVGYNITHVITQNTTNTAVAYGVDQYARNVTSSASAFVQVYSGADIKLTVTPSATKVMIGTSVSYLYNATNTGEVPLTGAIYDDVFGAVGNFVDLAPGGWVGFNVTHVLTQNTSNTATAYGVSQSGANVTSSASVFVEVFKIPNVVPEVPLGPVLAAVAMFLALGAYKIKPRTRNERQFLQRSRHSS